MSETSGQAPTAGVVVIGNEILTGKVTDTNSPYVCRELTFLGVDVRRLITIPDDFALIGRVVREYAEAYTWVFTSGGIGPTHDDLTIPAIAAAWDVPVLRHPALEHHIREHYGERLTDEHLLMAQVPEGAELIEIPGMYHPQVLFRNVYIFPGVPQLFQHKFNAIKSRLRGRPVVLREIFMRADEGTVAASLRETAERHGHVLIGSYPSFFREEYSLKVTVEGREKADVEAALAELSNRLQALPVRIVRVT